VIAELASDGLQGDTVYLLTLMHAYVRQGRKADAQAVMADVKVCVP
jgi:hypothetical protein